MGSGRFDPSDWISYSTTNKIETKSRNEIFTSRKLHPDLDPKGVRRESRDSVDNPNSTAIIIAQDVTGSMGIIAETMVKKGIPTLLTEIYERKPVTDPHVMCVAIGDIECDAAPLQVTQFEADLRIIKQLEQFYLEGGGGGNSYESYALAWYFAAYHTDIDCYDKRGRKGYLFTIGDENPTRQLQSRDLLGLLGTSPEGTIDMTTLLETVSQQWEVFHIVVEEGNYASRHHEVFTNWQELLGQRAIRLSDQTKLAEVIVSAIQVVEGHNPVEVIASWDGTTAVAVSNAIGSLTPSIVSTGGVVTL